MVLPTVAQKNRANIKILYGERQSNVRTTLRNTIIGEGYKSVEDFSELKGVETALRSEQPDLIILDSALPGGDSCNLIQSLRYNRAGENPFIPVIVTLWNADKESVGRIVSSGADDLLVNPISPAQLLGRIDALVFNRKPFVVTSDYIGPDRRDENARDENIPVVDVPNTLRQKAFGENVNYDEVMSIVKDVMVTINEHRLKRHSYQIAFLVRLIDEGLSAPQKDASVPDFIRRLSDVARDMGERLIGSRYEHVNDLCITMIETASRIAMRPTEAEAKDIALLKPLSDALIVGFNPDKQSADMASEINGMLTNFAARSR
jgi:DNA-binding response OmpR family regulator